MKLVTEISWEISLDFIEIHLKSFHKIPSANILGICSENSSEYSSAVYWSFLQEFILKFIFCY